MKKIQPKNGKQYKIISFEVWKNWSGALRERFKKLSLQFVLHGGNSDGCCHMLFNRMSRHQWSLDWGHLMLRNTHLANRRNNPHQAIKVWYFHGFWCKWVELLQIVLYQKFEQRFIWSLTLQLWLLAVPCVSMSCCVMWLLSSITASLPLSQIPALRLPRGYQGKCSLSLCVSFFQ